MNGMIFSSDWNAQLACDIWQERLGLLDWDIVVRIVRAAKFSNPEKMGEVQYNRLKKMAVILFLDPQDYDNAYFPQDHERTLVHELRHLQLSWMDRFQPSEDSFERGIWNEGLEQEVERTSAVLVQAFRTNLSKGLPEAEMHDSMVE